MARYNGSGLVAFCDGHVETIKAADTYNTKVVIWDQSSGSVAAQVSP
ncbi:MAG: hypothetical protein EBT50_08540 [Verrucomicrobia bacterium]|nr:hypothetical protein [Verrucomicrobiota bacterium]